MELASIWLQLDVHGSNIQKHNVTPAEALFLSKEFETVCRGKPIQSHQVTGQVQRTNLAELARLKERYIGKKVERIYAGVSPSLPQTFKEILPEITAVAAAAPEIELENIPPGEAPKTAPPAPPVKV